MNERISVLDARLQEEKADILKQIEDQGTALNKLLVEFKVCVVLTLACRKILSCILLYFSNLYYSKSSNGIVFTFKWPVLSFLPSVFRRNSTSIDNCD